jgi:hypothetical protein
MNMLIRTNKNIFWVFEMQYFLAKVIPTLFPIELVDEVTSMTDIWNKLFSTLIPLGYVCAFLGKETTKIQTPNENCENYV